jgi:ATP-dependent DNA helicase RecG
MKLRGPGDMLGTRQSGQLPFKLASLIQDGTLLSWTRQIVEQLLLEDPQLSKQENQTIKERWTALYQHQWGWNRIS